MRFTNKISALCIVVKNIRITRSMQMLFKIKNNNAHAKYVLPVAFNNIIDRQHK